jgi:hypothetical protein
VPRRKKIETWRRDLDTEPALKADASGRPVISVKRAAAEKNLKVGMEVMAKRRKASGDADAVVATITEISETGLKLNWGENRGEPGTVETVSITDVEVLAPKPLSASSQESTLGPLDSESIKWSPCSTFDNNDMLLSLTKATLYQAYVCRSCAHEDLHLNMEDGELHVYAKRLMKPKSLLLLPFGSIDGSASKGPSVPLRVEVTSDENQGPVTVEWRLRAKPLPKKITGTSEKAVALNPFWLLSMKPTEKTTLQSNPSQVTSELTYEPIAFAAMPPTMVSDVKSNKNKSHMVLKMTALVNTETVPKGALLYVTSKPPSH